MNISDLLARYPRIAVAGAPGTGKTTSTLKVVDRPVIHTDDWMYEPWEAVPALVAAACAGLPSFIVEGVRAPDALRKGGVEVDCVVWLSRPKEHQTPAQKAMAPGIHTVLSQWAATHPEIPIVTEETLTLDHAELPPKTRRYASFTLDAAAMERTPQGGLRIKARASKAGVFQYKRGDRVLREYRPASELRKPAALLSIKGSPVVVLHPDVNGGAVDTENFTDLTVGHFEDPFFNEATEAIEGWVVINDADTIERIASGELADISCAYDNGRDVNPGWTTQREPYDLTQIDFIFNHVALGPPGWGRQGSDVGLLTLDADDNQQPPHSEEAMLPKKTDDKQPPTKTQDADDKVPPAGGEPAPPSKTETKDELEELTADDIAAFKKVAAMLPELTKLLNTGNAGPPPPPAPTMEGGVYPPTQDGKKPTMDAADVERIAQEGVEVRTEAIAVLGADYSPRGKSTRQVRVDVIRTFDSKFDPEGKSDDAVTAAYSIALIAGNERAKNALELGRTRRHGTPTLDGQEQEPRKEIGHQAYEAWKN